MTRRTIWMVTHPDHDTDLTVIASSLEEACELAAEYCDEPERAHEYDGSERVQSGRRWVGFESRADAENQAQDLGSVGVDVDRVRWRSTGYGWPGSANVLMWEVGAMDADWCRLPAGVLCGGDQ